MPERAPSAPSLRVPALAATVFLVALCLRPAITSVGPVLPQIGADEGLGEGALGFLGALPLLAFAVVSPVVHRVSGRVGPERAVLAALGALAVGIAVRSWTGDAGLWVGTAVIGCATAVGNVLVPAIVRRDYATRVSRATGWYSASMGLAAGVASAVAVPLAAAHGWRWALGVWAGLVLACGAVWAWRARGAAHDRRAHREARRRERPLWRSGTAWLLTAFMALQSTTFYVMVTWLPSVEAAGGVSAGAAGAHLFVFQVVGIGTGLAIPLLMRDRHDQVLAAVVATAPMLVGVLGLLAAPHLAALWAVVAGAGSGASLVVALGLIALRGHTLHETARLSGMAQSVGYLVAAAGPVAAGYLAERTGSWHPTLWLVVAVAALQVLVGIAAGRPPATSG